MKIVFIQKYIFTYAGIMAISGFLRQNGHESSVIISSLAKNSNELVKKLREERPDIIAFSLMSTDHSWFIDIIRFVKREFPSTPIIAGGVHAMLYPDDLIKIKELDFVCTSEGEITTLQILNYIKGEIPISEVKGIIYKKDEQTIKNPPNNLIEDLDSFYEDRSVYYDRYSVLKEMPLKIFFSSRGCPYKCSFCINNHLQDKFDGLGSYIRRKSVEHLIDELERVRSNNNLKFIFFADDLFAYNKKWMEEFAIAYKRKIDIPFICTCRADKLTEDIVRLLSYAGCHSITFGVETGNEELRKTILNKKITDEQLIKAARLLKQYNLRAQTSNMFCLPGETWEDSLKTIDLNIKMGTRFTMSAIFMPFPKTELADICIKMGLLKSDYSFNDIPVSFVTSSVLKFKDVRKMERLQKVASLIIQYPFLRNPLVWISENISFYSLFFLLYVVGTVLRFREERKLNLFEAIAYVYSYRKNL